VKPTKVLIFDNPKAGAPLMLAVPSRAIDLPLKILVKEDGEGKVWISYNSPAYLQERHRIPSELLQNIALVEGLSAEAADYWCLMRKAEIQGGDDRLPDKRLEMSNTKKTVIVTGASQGIGARIVKGFAERDFNVVANSRKMTQSSEVAASRQVALVDGHIGDPATAAKIFETAMSRFKSIDALVNNAGIFFTKPFTDYTAEDIKSLVSTNVEGFLNITRLAIRQMLTQKTGGSIVTITAALARNPIIGVPAAVPMLTKGGLETITRHLAMEYAKDGIRVNAVAPGVVYTPLHRDTPKDVMESLSPMGRPSTVEDIMDAVMYLTDAATVTGDILYVDGGSHLGRW
jgi:NAD(P)-dependent dehydrogenase (short-subunit alcohol dehydrogenase family)